MSFTKTSSFNHGEKKLNGNSAIFFFFTLFCFALTACGGNDEHAMPAPGVIAMNIEPADIPYTGEYTGQTAGFKEVEVRAQVGGILLKRYYQEGQVVQQGDQLFQIDPAPYEAALMQAKGALAQAKASLYQSSLNYERMKVLYAQAAVSKKERDDAYAAYTAAKGDVESASGMVDNAQINLGYTTITSPISGATSQETFSQGNLVNAGTVVTNIVQLDPLYINFSIPGTTYLQLKDMLSRGVLEGPSDKKFSVDIKLADGTVHTGNGELDFIDPRVDPITNSIKARAQIANPGGLVLPGQFARAYLKGYVLKKAIAIPQKAVLNTQNGPMVYVIGPDNKAEPRFIEQEMPYGNTYIIHKGLKAGEKIIVDGILKARPGSPVKILSSNSTAPAK